MIIGSGRFFRNQFGIGNMAFEGKLELYESDAKVFFGDRT